MRSHVLRLKLLFLLCCFTRAKLPINFRTCRMNEPEFNSCLATAIDDALLKLRDGFPSLHIAPLEPLNVPSMTIGQGSGAVHVIQYYNDIKIFGATGGKVLKVDGSGIKNFLLFAETFTPSLKLEAKYKLNGRILLIPIQGDGNCTIELNDLKANLTISGERMEKKGKMYMKVKNYTISLQPSKVQFNFENLFNGDPRLGKEMNNILNQNWKEVFEDVKGGYEESFGIIYGDFANKVFAKMPFKDLFLE